VEEGIRDLTFRLGDFREIPPTAELSSRLTAMEEELEALLRDLGETRAQLSYGEKQLRRKAEIERRIEELERRLSVYGKLREDLKSDRLQDFAAALMLKRIVERSSDYLLSFSGAYEFDINAKGELLAPLMRRHGSG